MQNTIGNVFPDRSLENELTGHLVLFTAMNVCFIGVIIPMKTFQVDIGMNILGFNKTH